MKELFLNIDTIKRRSIALHKSGSKYALIVMLWTMIPYAVQAQTFVAIKKIPKQIYYHYFNLPGKLEYRLTEPNGGATTWFFGCHCHLTWQLKESNKTANSQRARILINGLSAELTLPINIWLKENASTRLIAHEEAHRQICEAIYENSEQAALSAAAVIIDQSFVGRGVEERIAINSALACATDKFGIAYRAKTIDLTNAIAKSFDRITEHGMKYLSNKAALQEAFIENNALPLWLNYQAKYNYIK